MYWRELSPHAREVVLRMVLTQQPAHFRHVENNDHTGWHMSFVIGDEEQQQPASAGGARLGGGGRGGGGPDYSVGGPGSSLDPHSDLSLAMRLGCRCVTLRFYKCFGGIFFVKFFFVLCSLLLMGWSLGLYIYRV